MRPRPTRPVRRLLLAAFLTATLAVPTTASSLAAPARNGTHIVEAGETLSSIAADAGTDVETLMLLNGLEDADALQVGETLILEGGSSGATYQAPAAAGSGGPGTHVVQPGETLAGIAAQEGVDPGELARANALENADMLAVGVTLVIPAPGSAPSGPGVAVDDTSSDEAVASQPAPVAASSGTRGYLVQEGDTLAGIAGQFGTTVDALLAANGLGDANVLAAGETIQVPAPSRIYVVQPGETLASIASTQQVDLGTLIDLNAMQDPDTLSSGQALLLPERADGGSPVLAASTPQPIETTPEALLETETTQASELTAQPVSTPRPAPDSSPSPTPDRTPRPVANPVKGDVAATALNFLGYDYVWGGSSPASGFDCSGFVWYVAQQSGATIGRGMQQQYEAGRHPRRSRLKRGDILFFQNTYVDGLSHNGIYLGDNQFVHAADEADGVKISRLDDEFWSSHWYGATRLSFED